MSAATLTIIMQLQSLIFISLYYFLQAIYASLEWEIEIFVSLLCLKFTSEYLKIKSNETINIVDSTHQEFCTGMLHRSLLRPKSPLRAQRQESFYQTQRTTSSGQNQQ